jgi:hypothetical protein
MPAPPSLVKAVEAAILASAHLAAYEHVAAAGHAVRRLGTLSSGRWRSAGRDLEKLEDDLQTAFADVARDLTGHAINLGIEEEALWTAGDAAATLDLLRDAALEGLQPEAAAARLLAGDAIFGVSFVEDAEDSDRGATLVFGWAEPLAPAAWPWQASWIAGDGEETTGVADDLDLYEAGELEVSEPLGAALATALGAERDQALDALRIVAQAVTRASLLAAAGVPDNAEEVTSR